MRSPFKGSIASWLRTIGLLAAFAFALVTVRIGATRTALAWAGQPIVSQLKESTGADSLQHVAFLFQSGDCPTSIGVIRDLNRVAASGQAAVRGYLLETLTENELSQLIDTYGIEFEIRGDMQEAAKRAMYQLGYSQTPLIITSSSSGQVRYVLESRAFDSLNRLADLVAPEVTTE